MSKKLIRFDWAIKHLLRDKANFDVLEGFLSALLEDNELKVLQILESESNQEDEKRKYNRVDILVEDYKNRKIIIEVQNTREADYLERLLFGASKTVIDNHKLGSRYENIHKVISVSILYFNLGTGDDYIYKGKTKFVGLNTGNPLIVKQKIETTDKYGDIKFRYHERDIFPEYYLIRVEKYPNIVKKAIDEWVYMFKNNQVEDSFSSKNIDKAAEKLAEINMTEKEKKSYESYLDEVARLEDQIDTAKEDGKIEMILEGYKNGVSIEILSKMSFFSQEAIMEIISKDDAG